MFPTRHLGSLPYGDKGTNLWNLWWVYTAVFENHASPLLCDVIFYPWGCDLRHHTLSPVNGLLAAPVTALFGANVAYNVLFTLWTLLTAYFCAMWARNFQLPRTVAFLTGFAAAFSPYRWAHLEHLNLFSTAWLFASFYTCETMFRQRGGARHCVLFTGAWLLAVYTDWYYGLFAGIYYGLRLLVELLFERKEFALSIALKTVVLPPCVIALSLFLYFYNPNGNPIPVDQVEMLFSAFWSLDLLHLAAPLWVLERMTGLLGRGEEFRFHPGLMVLLLFVASILVQRQWNVTAKVKWFWALFITVFLLFSFGPFLQYNGLPLHITGIPIPSAAIVFEGVPFLTSMRVYSRFAYIGFTGITLVAFTGLHFFSRRWINRRLVYVVPALALAVFLIETKWTFPQTFEDRTDREVFARMTGPVLELPFLPSTLSGFHLYHQTLHRQPIYVAEFSRLTEYKKRYLTVFPAFTILNKLSMNEPLTEEEEIYCQTRLCEEVRRNGITHVLLQNRANRTGAGVRRLDEIHQQCFNAF